MNSKAQGVCSRLGSREFIDNPYPAYSCLRKEAPVHFDSEHQYWVVTGYDEVHEALHNPGIYSSTIVSSGGLDPIIDRPAIMLCDDPPVHTFYRNLAKGGLTSTCVAEAEAEIRRTAAELIDNMVRKLETIGALDFVSSFASPLSVITGGRLLGVPVSRRPLDEWVSSTAIPAELQDNDAVRAVMRTRLIGTFQQLYSESPNQLLPWVRNPEGTPILNEEEAVRLTFMLWISAVEAPTFLLSNGMALLESHPETKRCLLDNPDLTVAFVEEVLRFESPIQGLFRRALQDAKLGGERIKAGDSVWLFFAAANRDEKYFPDPDRFDVERFHGLDRSGARRPHFAFGGGIHSCMGAQLARLEAAIGFRLLLERLPNMRTVPELGRRTTHPVMRGFSRLPALAI